MSLLSINRKRRYPRDIEDAAHASVDKFKRRLEDDLQSNNNQEDRDYEGRKLNVHCDCTIFNQQSN